jgi:ABC-2 type transport system permease protein
MEMAKKQEQDATTDVAAAPVRTELRTPVWVYLAAAGVTALGWAPWAKGMVEWGFAEWLPNALGFLFVYGIVAFPIVELVYWWLADPPGDVRPHPILANILLITAREVRSFFTGSLAYVVVFFLLGFSGIFFTMAIWSPRPQADVGIVLVPLVFLTLMASPLLTMNTLAQEKATGTIELLMTRPVRDSEVVIGKYLSVMSLLLITVVISLVFPLFIGLFGKPDWGRVISGYLGLVLSGGVFLALGLLASALVRTQVAAALVGYCLTLVVWVVGFVYMLAKGGWAEAARQASVYEHVQQMLQGVIESRSLVFFASAIVLAIFLSIRAVENRRTI